MVRVWKVVGASCRTAASNTAAGDRHDRGHRAGRVVPVVPVESVVAVIRATGGREIPATCRSSTVAVAHRHDTRNPAVDDFVLACQQAVRLGDHLDPSKDR